MNPNLPGFAAFNGFRLGDMPGQIDLRAVVPGGCSMADMPAAMAALADVLTDARWLPVGRMTEQQPAPWRSR